MKSFTTYKLSNKEFPEKLPPWNIIIVKALSTMAKFSLPLVLQSIYKNMENNDFTSDTIKSHQYHQSLLSILLKITITLSLSYFLDLFCEYLLIDYRLNLKKQLTKRIVQNSITMFRRFKQEGVFYITQSQGQDASNQQQSTQNLPQFFRDRLSLWTNISNKMPVYVYNYHNSLLSLVFESLNIIGVCVYLFMKLSYSLVFGLVLAIIIMKKIVSVTQEMQSRFFNNIKLRQKKLTLLKHFFNHLTEYKMTWLDKWIWDKISQTQNQYQQNLQEIKMLDVWCVALWRFTSVSISSVVVVAFYYLEIQATQTITPSTLIQFLMILTMPLNALSWNIAGVRNSLRAIKELKYTVCSLFEKIQNTQNLIEQNMNPKMCVRFAKEKPLIIKFQKQQKQNKYTFIDQVKIDKGIFISVQGKKQAQYLMTVLPFFLKNNIPSHTSIGYVEQNSWQIDNILQSLTFKQTRKIQKTNEQFPQLIQLLSIFDCDQIPQFSTITSKQLSGGQKMRINLVRAFFNCKIVVINSDLTSVDVKMRQKITLGIDYLIKKYQYTVFCRRIQVIEQKYLTNVAYLTFKIKQQLTNNIKSQNKIVNIQVTYHKRQQNITSQQVQFKSIQQVKIDVMLLSKLQNSIKSQNQRQLQIQEQQNPQKSKVGSSKQNSLDNLKWQTFTAYYKSKYHIVFLIGIICTTIFQHLYQFYMNNYVKIQSVHDGTGLTSQNVKYVILLTTCFGCSLFVRAYYFAIANIKESKRISSQIDQNIIMNQMQFYQNFTYNNKENYDEKQKAKQKIQLTPDQVKLHQSQDNKKTITLGSKLIYHSTSDLAQVSDNYSWQANIFFNNIFTTTSSILIVFSQIPFIGLILIPIIIFTIYINNQYQNQSQRLLKIQKKIQENLLKTVHQIQQGIKYIYLYGKVDQFKQSVYKSVDKQINIEWKLSQLKRNLNTKYKAMMIAFLVIIVISFGVMGLYPSNQQTILSKQIIMTNQNKFQCYVKAKYGICDSSDFFSSSSKSYQRNKSGKFAILINYTITLANFMLFFTVSLGETSTHALAIQRIRPLLSSENSKRSSQRIKDFNKILAKIQILNESPNSIVQQNSMISIKDLDFTYAKKIQTKENSNVFQGLSLELRYKQKIQIRGKSGNGKTTLYKLLCSLYKHSLNTIEYTFHISFSPQHPLILPSTSSIQQNIDPYGIFDKNKASNLLKNKQTTLNQSFKNFIQEQLIKQTQVQTIRNTEIIQLLEKQVESLTYKEKIIVNNLRAWFYGKNGIKIYDEPFWVDQSESQTYILTTHQRQFKHDKVFYLQNKKLSTRE